MFEKREKKITRWPLGLLLGDRVRAKGKYARVVEAYRKQVPEGHVPIRLEGRVDTCDFICIPADDIDPC